MADETHRAWARWTVLIAMESDDGAGARGTVTEVRASWLEGDGESVVNRLGYDLGSALRALLASGRVILAEGNDPVGRFTSGFAE